MAGRSWVEFSRMFPNGKELEKVMNLGCKGSVTEITKLAANMLHENTAKAFGPDKWWLTRIKKGEAKVPYQRKGSFANAVTINSKTENVGDSFQNMAYFDENIVLSYASRKNSRTLGTYYSTDTDSPVDVDDYLSGMEYGTVGSYGEDKRMVRFERKGAGFMQKTIGDIEAFLRGSGVDVVVDRSFGSQSGLEIIRMK